MIIHKFKQEKKRKENRDKKRHLKWIWEKNNRKAKKKQSVNFSDFDLVDREEEEEEERFGVSGILN